MNPQLSVIESKDLAPMLVAITMFVGIFSIPIVRMLIAHQQKMAELLRGPIGNSNLEEEIRGLRHDVAILHDRINALSIKLDGGAPSSIPMPPPQAFSEVERLRGSA